jgi:hypothetical protein
LIRKDFFLELDGYATFDLFGFEQHFGEFLF